MDSLQYAAGYVVHKFLVKAGDNPAYNSVENGAITMIFVGNWVVKQVICNRIN